MTTQELIEILTLHEQWMANEEGGNKADLRGAKLIGADLSDAGLRSANLAGANLSDANLIDADLSYADLSRANLSDADLSDANLVGANLAGANLSDANLSDVDLSYARLKGADLSGVNLVGANLNSAYLCPLEGTFSPFESLGVKHDPNLHILVAKEALKPASLEMDDWHSCETAHCLAGWAIHLSGAAGYALERMTSPSVAGAILCPELSHLFYSGNETALIVCEKIVQEQSQ